MIEAKDWKWFGKACHFIGGNQCEFHMATQVGHFLISTVGHYIPINSKQYIEIGIGRLFETMIFDVTNVAACDLESCGCEQFNVWDETDMVSYNKIGDAQKGHMDACLKWSKKQDEENVMNLKLQVAFLNEAMEVAEQNRVAQMDFYVARCCELTKEIETLKMRIGVLEPQFDL